MNTARHYLVDEVRLEKTFAKACHILLKIKLATVETRLVNKTWKSVFVEMDLNNQLKTLISHKPLKLRFSKVPPKDFVIFRKIQLIY